MGYKVERTQSTRDGGKDIIIRKPEILGDFIYYVECKKYAAKNHIGVGIIRNLIGTINTDRVNGGVLATTSYFSRDSKKFIVCIMGLKPSPLGETFRSTP
ncbi:MAG: restriction endonuclease [Eubacterium sp.]|nr:restriction endonuclease [Eubacterium sp.]